MNNPREIAEAWLAETKAGVDMESAPLGPAYHQLNRLVDQEPEQALEVIRTAAELQNDQMIEAVLAAGPLENLIARHGASIIGKLEAAAQASLKFRHLLGGVWPRSNEGGIVERIEALVQERW
jgi:hypothetical protein